MTSRTPIRLALGLGDQELEQRLRPALDADAELAIAAHCLAAEQIVQAVEAGGIDVAVVAAGLHRLSESVLSQLERSRVAIVLLASEEDALSRSVRGTVLSREVDLSTLRQAIASAARGERWTPRLRPARESHPPPVAESGPHELPVLVVAGGTGSPGRTTVAINLATALGAVAPTALVDLDCTSPSVAAYLNRDPSRNVVTLAHAVRESPRAWGHALEQELQPLHARSPSGVLLCGLPKRELRSSLTPAVVEQLIAELGRRNRYVIVDVGAELLGADAPAAIHRAAVLLAQHVLVVTGSDLVSLWHARIVLGQLERHFGFDRERMSLIVNRHDRRFHHALDEIEWHLGAAAAQVIPQDYAGLQKAIAEQTAVVADPTSRAARAILELAERIHQGRVRLPAGEPGVPRPRWRSALSAGVASAVRWGSSA